MFEDDGDSTERNPLQILLQCNYDEVMPGFHEHDENDLSPDGNEDNEDSSAVGHLAQELAVPPVLDPGTKGETNVGAGPLTTQIRSKPFSSSTTSKFQDNGEETTLLSAISDRSSQTCPICSKTLETDNHGINAHIDYCLSRDAIRIAHAEVASPLKPARSRRPDNQNAGSCLKGFGKLQSHRRH